MSPSKSTGPLSPSPALHKGVTNSRRRRRQPQLKHPEENAQCDASAAPSTDSQGNSSLCHHTRLTSPTPGRGDEKHPARSRLPGRTWDSADTKIRTKQQTSSTKQGRWPVAHGKRWSPRGTGNTKPKRCRAQSRREAAQGCGVWRGAARPLPGRAEKPRAVGQRVAKGSDPQQSRVPEQRCDPKPNKKNPGVWNTERKISTGKGQGAEVREKPRK